MTIPESNSAYSYPTINLSGSGGATLSTSDIVVVTVDINHGRDGDLDIFLVDPSGTKAMLLSSDNGGNGNNFDNTIFRTDASTSIINGSSPFNSTYLPEGSISASPNRNNAFGGGNYNAVIPASSLEGANIDGNWSLRVFDDNSSGGLGSLVSWGLSIIKQTGSGFTTVFNGSDDIGLVNYSGSYNETATVIVTPTTKGTHTYTATTTDSNGCTATSNEITVTVLETPDAFIAADYCAEPGKVRLTAYGGASGATYAWRNSVGNQIGTSQVIIIDLVDLYSVTVTNPNGCSGFAQLSVSNEFVTNGDFEAGNTGFITDYWLSNNLATGGQGGSTGGEGLYAIGDNAHDYHTNFWGNHDHTDGTGNYMIVNGKGSQYIVWENAADITIEPGTHYYFSAWAMSLNSVGNDAELRFEIEYGGNKYQIGSVAYIQPGVQNNGNTWLQSGQFYGNWTYNGATTTTARIRIINLRPQDPGNDFGIDDVSFGTLDPFPLEIEADYDEVCEGNTLFLYSNSQYGLEPITYSWTGPNGWTSTEANPQIPNATPAQNNGNYHLEATDGYGCAILPDDVQVVINEAPSVDAGADQEVCSANPVVILNGNIGGSATFATWSGSGGTFDDNTLLDASYTLSPDEVTAGFATLVLTTDDPAGACEPVTDEMTITIFNSLEITSIDFEEPLCNNVPDGTATANVTLGTPPYEYLWSNGQTTPTAIDLAAGEYWVQVTDANGCVARETVILTEPEPFVISPTSPQIIAPSCFNSDDGRAIVEVSGGIPPYVFQWDAAAGSQTTNTAENLSAGNYFVFVTDAAGCAAATIPVTIPNPPPPSLSCPPNVEDIIADNGCSITLGVVTDPVYAGFCDVTLNYTLTGATTTSTPGTGTVTGQTFNVGTTTVTYTITDIAGNSESCSFTVEVKDLNPPVFDDGCPLDDIEVDADANLCTADVTVPVPMVSDPCGEGFTLVNDFNGTDDASGTYPLGSTLITWTVTDASGNINTCEQTVIVNDVDKPTIDCIDVLFEDFISGNGCTLIPTGLPDPVIDDCELAGLTYELTGATTFTGNADAFNYAKDATFNIGITTVTYTVEDASGNTETCTFDVWIKNIDDPRFTVTCPTGAEHYIIVPAEPGLCDAEVTVPAPVIDNFCNEIFSITYNGTAISTTLPVQPVVERFDVGVYTVEWKITDASGNEYTCEQTVEVTDVNSVLACPADIERPVDPGEVFATLVPTGDPTVTNNCADPRLIWELEPPVLYDSEYTLSERSGNGIYPTNGTFWLGVTTITYSLTDVYGDVLIGLQRRIQSAVHIR